MKMERMISQGMNHCSNEKKVRKTVTINKKKEFINYYNLACGMDIETSSYINDNGDKVALMYCHQWKIEDEFYIARTWEEFRTVIDTLHHIYKLDFHNRLVIYVHNLPYEFQFFRKEIHIDSVFATDDRKAIKVLCGGIEFRDSYILTQKSLESVGNDVGVKKLKEDMNYDLIRTPKTPMTEEEIRYCYNDVDIIVQLIRKKITEDGNITKIPMTNTGYVRNFFKKKCYSKQTYSSYSKLMSTLTITSDEYIMLKKAFQGGFTHANAKYVNKKIESEVESQDFTSSYPAVMLSEKFPMSKARITLAKTIEDLHRLEKKYCYIVDISFYDLETKDVPDHLLSESKCDEISASKVIDNGRVVYADYVRTTITDVDLNLMEKFYTWSEYEIHVSKAYLKGYLPKPIIESMWKLYKDKTELKGISEKAEEYQIKKGMCNSGYGMIVTDIVRDEIIYESEWTLEKSNIEEQIEHYNNSKSRFLYYPWGVWVTAYARRNLLEGILEAGDDYVYADTDSRKIKHPERHEKYVESYNEQITKKITRCLKSAKIEYIPPKDIKGIEHPLGVWDYDGTYKQFKTLGAKRYVYLDKDNHIGFTVAGIPKRNGVKKIVKGEYEIIKGVPVLKKGEVNFDSFSDGFTLSEEESGKLTHTYIDVERNGVVYDYNGDSYEYSVKSGVHLSKSTASITISKSYEKYLLGIERSKKVM